LPAASVQDIRAEWPLGIEAMPPAAASPIGEIIRRIDSSASLAALRTIDPPQPSMSLSIAWRFAWYFAEADARAFHGLPRYVKIRPASSGRTIAATSWG
jgi:hypothetical protein